MSRLIDERTLVQCDLYPWILLSVLNRKKYEPGVYNETDKHFPAVQVRIINRESRREVMWSPTFKEVVLGTMTTEKDPTNWIGFEFRTSRSAVHFFETGSLNPLSMRTLHRVVSWKRLLQQFMSIQKEMASRDWEKLSEAQLFRKTIITLYSAVAGLNGLSQLDTFTRELMHHLPDGVIRIGIGGVSGAVATIGIRKGHLFWSETITPFDGYSVDFTFKNIRTAWTCVANLTDNLAAVGKGDIKLRGYIPLADGFNHMLDRLQMFVKVS
jgi:hypothetical protein